MFLLNLKKTYRSQNNYFNILFNRQPFFKFFRRHYINIFLPKKVNSICEIKSSGSENDKVVLCVQDDIYFNVAGVEISTFQQLMWLMEKYPKTEIYLYYYDDSFKKYIIEVYKNNTLLSTNLLQVENPDEIIQGLARMKHLRIALLNHLLNHSFNYPEILFEEKIKVILFVHDFFYCTPDNHLFNKKFTPNNDYLHKM
jgi:hypothetical protein